MGWARSKVEQVTDSAVDIVKPVIDTVKEVVVEPIVDTVGDIYMQVRDPLEAAAVVAGNYFVPGSGLITSQLVSDDAKEMLSSDVGKAAMIGSGLAGSSAGNTWGNAGSRFDAATAGSAGSASSSATNYGLSPNIDRGIGLKGPAIGEGLDLTGPASDTAGQGLTMNGGASANLPGMGGGQGVTGAAAGGGVLGATGVNTGAAASAGSLASNVLPSVKSTSSNKSTTTSALDDSAFYASILGLLKNRYDKYSETKTELGLAQGGDVKKYADGGAVEPNAPTATQAQAVTTAVTPNMQAAASTAGAAQQAVAPTPVVAQTTAAPTAVAAPTITAATSQPAMTAAMQATQAEQGVLSAQDLATAATQAPTTTALAGVQAAQGQATNVVAPAARTLQAGETVAGTAVEQPKVEAALAQNVAAQGTVTAEMTTQGQLNNMLAQFDAKNPPAWAAGTMRTAMAQLAARGLGASSLAGQAVVQAALEAATPIAAADAKVFEQMGLTNLSNRQQMAVLTGQQRAAFLGQEFDQNFQSRVINAAKISDIANKNFDAATTIALENARITNSMDVANLSARQAVVMANAAQMANLETTNLNNRQQVAVDNAKSFLQMDLTNLSNKQQTTLFKSQEIAQSILTDTAAENAAKAVNATNALDAAKVNAQLALTASQFNAAEGNKISLANSAMATDVLKFNAQEANDRADFNANMVTQINMANAKILADVSTANTRETNAMNAVNAKNATDMSAAAYAQLSQTYRDKLEMSWKTGDNELSRANAISVATITSSATIKSAQLKADGDFAAAMGTLVAKIGTSTTSTGGTVFGELTDWLKTKINP